MTEIESLEDLAEEGAASDVSAPTSFAEQLMAKQTHAIENVAKLVRCVFCQGHGTDPSKWAHLWGGACWVCGGWGSRREGAWKMRGPLAPHPSRR